MIYATFPINISLDDMQFPVEVEVDCSCDLGIDEELENIVIHSVFSTDMNREIEFQEMDRREVERLFEKAYKKLKKQYQREEHYTNWYEEEEQFERRK